MNGSKASGGNVDQGQFVRFGYRTPTSRLDLHASKTLGSMSPWERSDPMSSRAIVSLCSIFLLAASAAAQTPPNILVWQPPFTASESGEAMRDDLLALGEDAALSSNLFAHSAELSAHEIVMGVMGTTPDTHLLSDVEADALEAYVLGGGLLLLEGADVFTYDPDTQGGPDIRPMFGLGPGTDGDGVFNGNFVGIGAFASYQFDYFGEPSFLDELDPVTSTPLLRKQNNDEVHGVFLPEYGAGSTIGLSCEYAGLRDPDQINDFTQRRQMLTEFLQLLRGGTTVATPNSAVGMRLHPASPNPVRGRTTIRFDLPRDLSFQLKVYDLRGRLVRLLPAPSHGPGSFRVEWNARDDGGHPVAAGVYLVALEAGQQVARSKVVVLD